MKKKLPGEIAPPCRYLLSLLLTLFCIPPLLPLQTQAQRFQHPGVPFTTDDLNKLKQNITQEPWLSAYTAFRNNAASGLSYGAKGPFASVSRAPDLNNNAWKGDMVAIHNLALMWIFTGDSAYARKATNLLDSWAVTNTVWGGSESMLDIGDYAQYWATGADILKSTFPGWTALNTAHVNNYFANVLYPTSYVPYPLRDQNKGAIQLKIALGAAAFLDDATKFNQAIEVYRMDAGGGLRNSLPNGEVGDAGRDDHWRVQAAALAWGAEVAYKQGIDMFAELDNRLLSIAELYHQFSFDGDTMTFIPFGGYASYWTNWGIRPGIITGDMTNIIKSAYHLRKGIATPHTDRMRTALGGAGGNFLFLKSADTATAVALPPVVYPGDNVQPVMHLTNMDIGNAGMAGSATYSNGVWTLKGAGTSLSNAFNYTFQKMAGNSAVVVKVEQMSATAGGCGIMVRQSLAPGAPYWNIHLNGAGGVGRHWQPKAPWWLKMERVGNRIFGYHSHDGVNWTNLLCFYEPANYTDSLLYGFYTISNNVSALNTATFSNVAFSAAAPAGAPQITSATAAGVQAGAAFNYAIAASNTPVTYSAAGLPDGLSINSTTGVISGTPTTLGTTAVSLYATNAAGTGTAILVIRVTANTAPAAPAGVTATATGAGAIQLGWTASANTNSYSVKRSLTSGGPYVTIASGITTTTFTDVHPVPEVLNYYVVTALADTLESAISDQASAAVPPAIPGKPAVTSVNGQLHLNWAPGDGAVTYSVKRSMVTGGPYTTFASVTGTTYTDTAVASGTPYYYVVVSVGSSLQSANSPEGFGVPGAGTYTWVNAAASTNWSDTANWVEGTVPASPAVITFKTTEDSVLNNNLAGLSTLRVVFDTTASSYTITGNAVTAANEIINQSYRAQALNAPLVLNGALAVNAKSQNLTLNGGISGTGSLKSIGRSIVYIKGLNTYSGNTTIWGDGTGGMSYGVGIAGVGTGTPGAPTAGPLGTGKIILDGGTLHSEYGDVTLYNDIEVMPGKRSYLYEGTYGVALYGRITGSGTLWNDCNTYAGLHMFGDNSGFTGLFVNALRSGNNRLRFNVPQSGSANATWNLDANGVDCQSLNFASGTIHFGALTGRGYFRNNAGGAPVMSVGALNTSTWFSGTINGTIGVEKVGTGNWEISGNHTYSSATTVRNGRLLLNNNAATGSFVSALTVAAGAFGGAGRTTGTVTIGTGNGAGAALEPGNLTIGTLTTTNTLTLLPDATWRAEINLATIQADKMVAANIVLNNPALAVTFTAAGTLSTGTSFVLAENTGSAAVNGTFKDLPEMDTLTIGGNVFRITYKGGDGNDIVLRDDRAVPVTITSPLADTVLVGRAYQYVLTAIKAPSHYSAAGLPAGLLLDTATGIISGIPVTPGNYLVTLAAANDSSTGTAVLQLIVKNNIVAGVIVASGDARTVVEWEPVLNLQYQVKRSTTQSGPYSLLAQVSNNYYTDTTVTNGTVYYYVVAAMEGSTVYNNSTEVVATPAAGQWVRYAWEELYGNKPRDEWGARHATLAAAAVRDSGYTGQALKLNGTATAYASLPADVMSGLSSFTISSWIKMDALATWMRLFDFGRGTNNYLFFAVQAGNGMVRYAAKNGGTEQGLSYNYAMPVNTWTHIAITYAANTTRLFINGTQVATSTAINITPAAIGAMTQNYLGKSQYTADPMFRGSIDEFRIYNRALSAAEITAGMTATQTISAPQLALRTIGDSDFTMQATTSSGLPLSYSSADTSVAVIDAQGRVRVTGAGNVTLTVQQVGNARYKPAAASRVLTVRPLQLSLLYKDGDNAQTINNSIRPYWRILNNDTAAIALRELTVRYWITPENYTGIRTFIDYAALGNVVTGRYVPLTAPRQLASGYVEYSFDAAAGVLLPGTETGAVQTRIADNNWTAFEEVNDYSYAASAGYIGNTHISVYRNGKLIAGVEPAAEAPVAAVSAYTLNSGNNNNAIQIWVKLHNDGNVPLAYGDITLRYWFSTGDSLPVNYWIDYAQLGSSHISGTIQRVLPEREGADHYLELAVNPVKDALYPYSTTGNIQLRIVRSNWGNIQPANDYSWLPQTAFAPNNRVTVYYKGALIWGTEPAALTVAVVQRVAEPTALPDADVRISLYPNPATDVLYIQVPQLHNHAQVSVATTDGRVIISRPLKQTKEVLKVSHWNAGLYFVTIQNGTQVITQRILKQ